MRIGFNLFGSMKRNAPESSGVTRKKKKSLKSLKAPPQRFLPWLLLSYSPRNRLNLSIPIDLKDYGEIQCATRTAQAQLQGFEAQELPRSSSFRTITYTPVYDIIKEYIGMDESFVQYDLAVSTDEPGPHVNPNITRLLDLVNRSGWDFVHRFQPTYMAVYPQTSMSPIEIQESFLQQWQAYALLQLQHSTINRRVEHPANLEYRTKTDDGTLVFSPNGRFYEASPRLPYTRAGIVPSVHVHGAMVCSPTGTGKTVLTTSFIDWILSQPPSVNVARVIAPDRQLIGTCAVVMPPHVLKQWQEAFRRFPGRTVACVYDKLTLEKFDVSKIGDWDVLLISTSLFTTNKNTKKKFEFPSLCSTLTPPDMNATDRFRSVIFRCTVVDEAHAIECPYLIHTLSNTVASTFNVLLTATPRLDEEIQLLVYSTLMMVTDDNNRPVTRLPLSSFEYTMFRPGTRKQARESLLLHNNLSNCKDLLRAVVFSRVFLNTEVVSTVKLEFQTLPFYDTPIVSDLTGGYGRWLVNATEIFTHRPGHTFQDRVHSLTERYIDRAATSLYTYRVGQDQIDRMRDLVERGRDKTTADQFGQLVSPTAGVINAFDFPERLYIVPVQVATIRAVQELLRLGHRTMVYCEDYKWLGVVDTILGNLGTRVLKFAGPLPRLNNVRRQFEAQTTPTVLLLHSNHVEGSDFPSVSCVLVVGPINNRVSYKQVLGRVTRFARNDDAVKSIPVIRLVSKYII